MGLFNYVDAPVGLRCPECGAALGTKFQTKDGDCCMEHVDFKSVYEFHTICECGGFVVYRRKNARGIRDFVVEVEP